MKQIHTFNLSSFNSAKVSISRSLEVISSSSRRWVSALFQFKRLPIFLGVESGAGGGSILFLSSKCLCHWELISFTRCLRSFKDKLASASLNFTAINSS